MLRVYCLALCLAIVSSLAISNKRQIGSTFENYEQHPAARTREKNIVNGRVPLGPPKTKSISLECNTKNSNDKCKQVTPRGGTFLTNLEGTSYGPGFPPKPVGLLVRPNISREEVSSTSAPEGRFLVDDKPPLPPPPLKRRPLPKGRLQKPLLSTSAKQGLFQEEIDTMLLGPLFQEDLHNLESTTQAGENIRGTSQENLNGSGERNRAFLDSFNELDHPDPKLLSQLKGKLYSKYYAEKRISELKGREDLHTPSAENEEEDESNDKSEEEYNSQEQENSGKSQEEKEPVSGEVAPTDEAYEDYESSKEETNQDNSEEEHSTHTTEEEPNEEEESSSVAEPDNPDNSEEEENHEDEKPEKTEGEGSLHPITPPTEKGVESPPLIKQDSPGSLENSRQNSSSSREQEGAESGESGEDEGQNSTSSEAAHSDEESTEDRDYSEENNNIDSSAPSEDSEEVTYHLKEGDETSDESNESSQKPASSSEDTNEIRPSSLESSENVDEDYDSREPNSQEEYSGEQYSQEQQSEEQHSQEQGSEESPENSWNEYDEEEEEEKPTDYYDLQDYDDSTESEYEDVFPKPDQEPTKKPQVYYKKRPATFYFAVGGSEGEKKEPNADVSKPLDYEDNEIKQPGVSTPSAEKQASPSSDESFSGVGFDSFDLDSALETPQVGKTTKSPVAVITNTTPQTGTTKCDDNDNKKQEDPDYQKRLKTPLVTAKPNTLQPGDVVSFTRARPINFGLSPTAQTTTSTFRPATISAIGIVKPGGSIIAKVVSPKLQVHNSTSSSPTKVDDAQTEAPVLVPWKILLAAREATALTYLKPPPIGQAQTWFLRKARTPRSVEFLSGPL